MLNWFPKEANLVQLHFTHGCGLLTLLNLCVPLPYQNFNALRLILVRFVEGFKDLKGEVAKYQFQEFGCPKQKKETNVQHCLK